MSIITKNIKDQILKLYSLDKTVVEDDKRLIANIWQLSGWDSSKDLLTNLRAVPSAETIRRSRQKLHQDGLIEYSEDVDERRYKEYKKTTEELGNQKAFFTTLA